MDRIGWWDFYFKLYHWTLPWWNIFPCKAIFWHVFVIWLRMFTIVSTSFRTLAHLPMFFMNFCACLCMIMVVSHDCARLVAICIPSCTFYECLHIGSHVLESLRYFVHVLTIFAHWYMFGRTFSCILYYLDTFTHVFARFYCLYNVLFCKCIFEHVVICLCMCTYS